MPTLETTSALLPTQAPHSTAAPTTHPAWVRITHWVNAIAFVVMLLSGWRIYNASPIFKWIHFPPGLTLGGWLGGALLWHFAAMWLLVVNGLLYVALGLVTHRLRHHLLPLRFTDLLHDTAKALQGKLQHTDLGEFNAIQKIAYLTALATLVVIVLSGLAVFKSVQFPLLRLLFGGYDNARIVHFICMAILVAFLGLHVVAAALFPRSILAIIRGR